MNQLRRAWVWLSRAGHCRGFGIQSKNDYEFVRYVVNEHWPYYEYDTLGHNEDWLTRKLGRLYFRLANWRQPEVVIDAAGSPYWQAGCRRAEVKAAAQRVELMRLRLTGDYRAVFAEALKKVDRHSVIVVEDLWRDWAFWRETVADERTGVTFDLYYCGIVMFDKKRVKHNYIINY